MQVEARENGHFPSVLGGKAEQSAPPGGQCLGERAGGTAPGCYSGCRNLDGISVKCELFSPGLYGGDKRVDGGWLAPWKRGLSTVPLQPTSEDNGGGGEAGRRFPRELGAP